MATATALRPRIEQPAQTGVNIATFTMIGVAPYSQSGMLPRRPKKEDADAFDERVWHEHAHANNAGQIVIPGTALKKAIIAAATLLKERVPGKGQSTYTKLLTGGILVLEDLPLVDENGMPYTKAELRERELIWAGWCDSQGKPGMGSRVFRRFPEWPSGWVATARITVVNPALPPEVVKQHVEEAGRFIGIGRWRAEKGGNNGRFILRDWAWQALVA